MTARLDRRFSSRNIQQIGTGAVQQLKKLIPSAIALAVFLGIWQLLCSSPDSFLPGPLQVFTDTWDPLIIDPFFDNGGTDKGLGLQIFASLQRVAIGYSLSALIGIGLGILIGTTPIMYQALDPLFQVLRTIPPLAWLPIALALFRQANPSAIFVIFITAIWPILINTAVGVQQIPQDYNNVAKVLRLSRQDYFFKILLPAAVPYIFTGLRIAVGLAWLAIVAAEMLTGGVGIGFFIWDAYNSSALSEIIVALVYVGVVGLLLDRLVALVADRVVPEERK
ncbi:nitrate ABC transporter permease [Leptolyngbya sp. FACHB-261]|uniref:nitrate ABC transporter permease n=1 Tax=Leptolyngbya sp. FACHB-261 TaxID=2692806 RepID=UPI001689E36A|nr:nitrate ABC transporter permease [Leptolyngbya sp. FACHB-261]MBD2104133.1 nitrate ABC transporter permease [Leptolyngbya sp. FACHB-261]